MTFTARIIRHSPVWKMWRSHHRTGGSVCGVTFRWAQGDEYVSGVLAPAQVLALRGHGSVRLESSGVSALVVEEAVAETAAQEERRNPPTRPDSTLKLPPRPPRNGNDRRTDIGGSVNNNANRAS